MLDALKTTFAAPSDTRPNAGHGTSYAWSGSDWALKLNDFGSQCNGILFRP